MKVKTRYYAGRDSMPDCMQNFLYSLEHLAGVGEVRRCDLLRRRQNEPFQARAQHYDQASKVLRIKAESGPHIAFFNLKIDPRYREEIEQFVQEYRHKNINNNL